MLDTAMLEQRLAILETEVAVLKQQAKGNLGAGSWLERLTGSISDDAGFEQVLAYGHAFRNSDRPADQNNELGDGV